jgi:alpha-galactosidase
LAIDFKELGLDGKNQVRDLWQHKDLGKSKNWKGNVQSHETIVLRLKKVK